MFLTRWWRLLPWLRTRRLPLAEIIGTELDAPDGEHRPGFGSMTIHLSTDAKPLRVPVWWPLGHTAVGRALTPRLGAVLFAIDRAVRERQRMVLAATVGLGPWSDDVWREVEAIAPSLRDYHHEMRSYAAGTRVYTHRELVGDVLADWRGEPPPDPFPHLRGSRPRPPDTSPGPHRGPPASPGWTTLIDHLAASAPSLHDSRAWHAFTAELLDYVRSELLGRHLL
ncbi:hypothetical protein [Yinghuangia aomiensis]|uniref:hypothetical protein n=1 Tax=Yinghuangia aomiensis TaxID=676205 RepID=UPI0031E64841